MVYVFNILYLNILIVFKTKNESYINYRETRFTNLTKKNLIN